MIVLIAVTEKQVVITDTFNAAPITGRNSIFARVNAPTEARLDVEIVAVCSTLEAAALARAAHAASHPGRRYLQKVARLDEHVEAASPAVCIRCAVPTGGPSYCGPCQKAFFEECRQADPLAGAPDPVPVVQATAGQFAGTPQ